MKEIKSIINAYNAIDFSKNRASLATVVHIEGSSYRRTGARMLVLDNGSYFGGISGGCLEGDALRRAQQAIAAGKASLVTYDTTQDDGQQIGVGLGCNGIIDVLFTPLNNDDACNPVRILSTVAGTRIPRIVISVINCREERNALGKVWVYESDDQCRQVVEIKSIVGELLLDIHDSLEDHVSKTIDYKTGVDTIRVFVEVILPVTHLVIYGSNNDIYPVMRIADELGWDITVVTNTAKANKSLFALASTVLHNKSEVQPDVDTYTALILMAHDYKTDYHNLQKALLTNAGYIGLLGPAKRAKEMMEALETEGHAMPAKNNARIYAPAGLDIGANTAEEIALSMLAEIQACFADRKGASLRLREGTIHETQSS